MFESASPSSALSAASAFLRFSTSQPRSPAAGLLAWRPPSRPIPTRRSCGRRGRGGGRRRAARVGGVGKRCRAMRGEMPRLHNFTHVGFPRVTAPDVRKRLPFLGALRGLCVPPVFHLTAPVARGRPACLAPAKPAYPNTTLLRAQRKGRRATSCRAGWRGGKEV